MNESKGNLGTWNPGRRFRALRRRRRLTQAALAKKTGVHRNTVSNTERNPGQVRLDLLMRQAAILGKPVWEILRPKNLSHANVQDVNSAVNHSQLLP